MRNLISAWKLKTALMALVPVMLWYDGRHKLAARHRCGYEVQYLFGSIKMFVGTALIGIQGCISLDGILNKVQAYDVGVSTGHIVEVAHGSMLPLLGIFCTGVVYGITGLVSLWRTTRDYLPYEMA